MMKHRFASLDDTYVLGTMNQQLAADEGHRNRLESVNWFKDRMIKFLSNGYFAVIFEKQNKPIAYALYKDHAEYDDTICLRQFFVDRLHRNQGIGKKAVHILLNEVWSKEQRVLVEALTKNLIAISFYKSMGFSEYSVEFEYKRANRKHKNYIHPTSPDALL